MSKTFFFQQNETKIKDFDEGVLILEQFFWGNVIFKICSCCIKSHVWGREEILWVAPADCNEYKARAGILYPGKPNNGQSSVRKLWLLSANLENEIVSEKRP